MEREGEKRKVPGTGKRAVEKERLARGRRVHAPPGAPFGRLSLWSCGVSL